MRGAVAQRPAPACLRTHRAWEHLIPAREARALAVYLRGEGRFMAQQLRGIGIACGERVQLVALSHARALLHAAFSIGERATPVAQTLCIRSALGPRDHLIDQLGAAQQIAAQILSRLLSLEEVASPGFQMIDPGLDRVERTTE